MLHASHWPGKKGACIHHCIGNIDEFDRGIAHYKYGGNVKVIDSVVVCLVAGVMFV